MSLPEFRFHQLKRRRLTDALPDFLEAALAEGLRVVLRAGDEAQRDSLNDWLWTYREDSFLPHGIAGEGEAATQPIYLTAGDEVPNGARLRVLLTPLDAPRFINDSAERVAVMFEERDPEAVVQARVAWKALAGQGLSVSFWQEGDEGGWVRAR